MIPKLVPQAILASAFALGIHCANAQSTIASSPVVYHTITVESNPSFPVFNLTGTNIAKKNGLAAGEIDGTAANSITDTEANFVKAFDGALFFDRDFDGPDPTFPNLFVEITSGPNSGINTEITTFTATTLTTMDDLSTLTSAGDTYIVRELMTIADVFGPGNSAGLYPADGSGITDRIWVPRGSIWDKVYYNPAPVAFPPLTQGWKVIGQGDADAANLPLYLTNGLIIERAAPPDLDIVLVGHVRTKPVRVAIEMGFNTLDRLYPIGATLGNSGLDALTHGIPGTADLIWMPKPDNQGWDKYYYNTPTAFPLTTEGWKLLDGGDTDRGSTPLTPAIIIERRTAGTNILITPDPAIYDNL